MSAPLVFVRFRAGVVGESRRAVHLMFMHARLSDSVAIPDRARVLTALCGQTFSPGEAEILSSMGGMPCEMCLRLSPGPGDSAMVKSPSLGDVTSRTGLLIGGTDPGGCPAA
jgi:hypothetical protein